MGQEEGEEKTEHTVEWARENLSRAQIDEFKQAFDIFDEDGGGDISTENYQKNLPKIDFFTNF